MVLQTPPACRTSNSHWLPSTSSLIGLRQPAVTEAPPLTSLTYDRPGLQDAALQPRGTSFHRLANKYNYYLFLSPLSNINNNSQDNNLILRIWKREEKRAKLNLFDFIYWIICVCVFPCARRSFTERIGLIRGCKQFSNQQKNVMLSFAHSYVALMIKIKVGIVNAVFFPKLQCFSSGFNNRN